MIPEIPAFDCESECLCEGDLSLCPNVQMFGAAVLEYVTGVVRKSHNETKVDIIEPSEPVERP